MDVYEFLNNANDLSNVIVTIFDCDSQEVVFNGAESDDPVFDCGAFHDFDVGSFDIFKDRDGRLCLELNICMGDDEE